ncbi:hypothetical protein SAMN06265379_10737 [Saccharicrinis carchari]|uniref:Uncharacterized protein n=2 Tax=Saccharicrinis carchari TaxID=1168039 RepID=A0A521DYC8_SACCC|nr:hypothetical protein SAMN06265379_10737 [Saccharicrinis carchari]
MPDSSLQAISKIYYNKIYYLFSFYYLCAHYNYGIIMKRDFSTFKVLGITLLVTMSSCVVGSIQLNAETLRTYGMELGISTGEETQYTSKQKKSKTTSPSKLRINHIIESGRTHIPFPVVSINHAPLVFHVSLVYYPAYLINKAIHTRAIGYSSLYQGMNFQNRAGPGTI